MWAEATGPCRPAWDVGCALCEMGTPLEDREPKLIL